MFIDVAKIKVKAGDGGNGAVSFHREKYVAAGGPDGGDGGKGGNVVFRADSSLSTLADFRYKRKYAAKGGENGKGKRASGKSAEDLVIRVPKGTLVKDTKTGKIIADISKENEEFVIAKGGRGGYGNMHFATPTRQVPRFSKPGLKGEEIEIQLELKLLADVGLVGFPNVGKSTLISVVSHAKPVIANYHFTTITPVLGVVRMQEGSSFVIADIPGLIRGAGEGLGLGHQFLKHIERCRLLIHVVDVSGSEGRNPIEDFNTINEELVKFNPELSKKTMIVAMNKCDLATEEQIKEFKDYVESNGYKSFEIMAPIRYGIDNLLKKVQGILTNLPPIKVYEAEYISNAFEAADDNEIKVKKINGKYYIKGKRIERLIESVNFDDYESSQYFQKKLMDFGAIDKLHKEGVQEGDTVNIYDVEFEFFD